MPRRCDLFDKVGKNRTNREGYPAYSLDNKTRVANLLTCGNVGDAFYATVRELAIEYANELNECAKNDPEFLAKAVVYARNYGYTKTLPIAGLTALSANDVGLYKLVNGRVLILPTDCTKHIDFCRSGAFRKGCGRAVKKALISYLERIRYSDVNDYYALKYRRALEQVIRVARPRIDVNPILIDWVMNRKPHTDKLEAYVKFMNTNSPEKQRDLILLYGLPYEVVVPHIINDPRVWSALAIVAPYTNLLRNLRTFYVHGALYYEDTVEIVATKLTNPSVIRKAKVFPYSIYVAYREFDRYIRVANKGYYDSEISDPIFDGLKRAVDISVSNVPFFEGRIAVALDLSGSMAGRVVSNKTSVTCAEVAGLFAGIVKNRCNECTIIPFGGKVKTKTMREMSEIESPIHMARLAYYRAVGGTSLAAPIAYLIDNDIEVDRIICITDNEEWIPAYVGSKELSSVEDAIREYAKRVNPDVEVIFNTIQYYGDYPVERLEYAKKKTGVSIKYTFGWSDSTIRYAMTNTDLVNEIENMVLDGGENNERA